MCSGGRAFAAGGVPVTRLSTSKRSGLGFLSPADAMTTNATSISIVHRARIALTSWRPASGRPSSGSFRVLGPCRAAAAARQALLFQTRHGESRDILTGDDALTVGNGDQMAADAVAAADRGPPEGGARGGAGRVRAAGAGRQGGAAG